MNVVSRTTKRKQYTNYKDSGVEWLGQVPEHWALWKLSHAFRLIGSGTTPQTDNLDFYNGDIPWVTTSELRENLIIDTTSKLTGKALKQYPMLFLYPPGTLLIAMYGATIGRLGILGILACTNQACCAFASPVALDIKFAFYWLSMRRREIVLMSSGGGQPNINQEKLRSLKIPAPSLDEQCAIAAFLDLETAKIDALIAKKERLIELLQEKRAALINHAVTKGLDPSMPMKDSGVEWLGDVPEHWDVKRLRFCFEFLNSKRVPISSEERGKMVKEYPYYGASGIIDYVENYIFDETLILIAEDGANLFSRSTPLAFVASGKYWVNNHAHILRPVEGPIEYFSHLLAVIVYDPWISGSAQPKLTKENLGSIYLPVPPKDERKTLNEYLNSETTKFDKLNNKILSSIEKLKEYRATIISVAVTGKIDVRNWFFGSK